MSYYSLKKQVKETSLNKTVAVATHEVGAEIIVKALNFYLIDKTFTENESVKMMHQNTAQALKSIADLAEREEMDGKELVDYLIEIADEMEAQALVVSMRDELKFDKPK